MSENKNEYFFRLEDVKTFPDTVKKDDKITFIISKTVYDKLLMAKNTLDIITALVMADKGYDALRVIEVLIGKEGV